MFTLSSVYMNLILERYIININKASYLKQQA
jgi:hypothetical protein